VGQDRSLAEHWNGARWQIIPVPNRGLYHNELDAVTEVAPDNVWAVGHYDLFPTVSDEALVEHWNGHTWAIIASPHTAGQHSGLVSVAAVPRTASAWAVGYKIVSKVTKTLIERWNGTGWSTIPSPGVGAYHNELDGVTAVSSDDAWAVGWYFNGSADRTLIEHWDGRTWSVVASPNANNGHNSLSAVAELSANQIFAVGQYFGGVNDETLIEEWNGRSWQVIQSANSPQHLHNELDGVAAAGSVGAIAVGTYFDGSADRTLIERTRP
jgi:hypothetical protein